MSDESNYFLMNLFIEKYNGMLIFAKRHLSDTERAEELVQDTFVSVQRNIEKVMQHPNSGGWLYQTLKYKIQHEKDARQQYIKLQMALSQQLDNESQTTKIDDTRLELLDILTDEEHELLTMIYLDGYKIKEATTLLGISYDACRKRVQRARDKLSQKYDENFV